MNYSQASRAYPGAVMPAAATGSGPGVLELTRLITEGVLGPLADALSQITANFSDTMGGFATRSARAHRAPGRKEECGCKAEDPCQCTCCIVDADVVVYGYNGEQRVIPLLVENR